MKRQKPKLEIFTLRVTNCNLKEKCLPVSGAEVPWNGTPERVTVPYVVPLATEHSSMSRVVLYYCPKWEIDFFQG